ncbi:RsmB/NOP family class I SAM-dependent RNA methyltransferase [Pseudorhodoferax sp. Leaf274]|uniref:RsmB/NOP family class I SAM-dependent RNA methyltransferase n=1 Tax=Pseudorhodoferax sp. Leaf274 TaxID=1736318 RepID=UPI000703A480|nr:RsmB/NOP family class I SAM-dependent RNA methyltransferase [Pseudorhodoferax sp. Leaf274]KQP43277.1 SAM-dependent methyltransferase [Pseudorhodoferax sp. Leaf274]
MHPKAVLDACADLVREALVFDHPADAVAARFFRTHRGLGPRERATLSDTLFAVLRRKLQYEHFAPSGSGPRERRLAILGFGGPRDFLFSALSPQEKEWLQQCEAVATADLLDRHRHNLPEWLAQPLRAQLGTDKGQDFWPLADSLLGPAPLDLRVNQLGAKRADVQQELQAAGIEAQPTPHSPWGLRVQGKPALNRVDAFTRGAVEVQDEGSQLLALLLDARRGEMVTDFCAGAGGKTLAIGATMRNTGRLYAFDTSAHRLEALKPRLGRSGLSNVHPVVIAHERDDRIKRLAGKMDRVLVDAPCSGTGTLRRHPDLKWRQDQRAVDALSALQLAVLQSAARLLKPGGRLVYATCSLLAQENEDVAAAFTAAQKAFVPLPVAAELARLKVDGAQGLCTGPDGQFLRLWPHRHATDGFFAAIWQRQA